MRHSAKTLVWSWLASFMVALFLGDARAADSQQQPVDVPNYRAVDESLSPAVQIALSCPSTGIVAFSVTGSSHLSQGALALLGYETTVTNLGGGWVNGGNTFIAPCSGLYSFTVSFVKDAYYNGATPNDVFMYITHNGVHKGFAWSGASGIYDRNTGAYTVALFMNAGDYVQTYAGSDGGYLRHLRQFSFTGILVKASLAL